MEGYALIDLDKMEGSEIRRRLRQWNNEEQAIKPLIEALQQKGYLSNLPIRKPRWETSVYPLYYYWKHQQEVNHREVSQRKMFERLFEELPPVPQEDLRPHIRHIVNAEVDLLVEDDGYFIFIEAKIAGGARKARFENKEGVHQLVCQYVQGRILEKRIGKKFALATIGAHKEQTIEIRLNPDDQAFKLLRWVGEERQSLEIPDFAWSILRPKADAAGIS